MLALLGTTAACERNKLDTLLVPTGVRPRPETGTGAIVGRVVYDPAQSPDLGEPPYPLTIVFLYEAGAVVATDTLAPSTRSFEFRALPPGTYTVVVDARMFERSSLPPVRVVADAVDVGDLLAPFDLDQLTTISIHVSGDFNEFAEAADSCAMQQLRLGLWYGPNIDPVFTDQGEIPPDTALTLEAGDHRVRYIRNFTSLEPFYVGATDDIVNVPATHAPLRLATEPEAEMKIHIPVTGRYRFFLDERRRTVTIEPVPLPVTLSQGG